MGLLIRLVIVTLGVLVASNLINGVSVDSTTTAIVVAIVFGLLNTLIKPILTILTLPITIITLGLFYFVINVFIVYATAYLVSGFEVSGFFAALLFSIVVSIISWLLGMFVD